MNTIKDAKFIDKPKDIVINIKRKTRLINLVLKYYLKIYY